MVKIMHMIDIQMSSFTVLIYMPTTVQYDQCIWKTFSGLMTTYVFGMILRNQFTLYLC